MMFFFGIIIKTADMQPIEQIRAQLEVRRDVEVVYSAINRTGFWLYGKGWSSHPDVFEDV